MSLHTELEQAGQRAALQPVPQPPPLLALAAHADKDRAGRRLLVGGLMAVLLAIAAIPVAVVLRGSGDDVQTVAAGTATADDASMTEGTEASDGEADSFTTSPGDEDSLGEVGGDESNHVTSGESRIELRVGNEIDLSVRTVHGESARREAERAAASATETEIMEDTTVWISHRGNRSSVAALVGPDHFVEIDGPSDRLGMLIDMLAGATKFGPFAGFDASAFEAELNLDELFPDGQPNLDELFPDGQLNLDELFPDGQLNLDELFPDGQLNLDELFPDGQPNLDELFPDGQPNLDELFPDGQPNLDELFEGLAGESWLFGPGETLEGCVSIEGGTDGNSFHFEFPEGCADDG